MSENFNEEVTNGMKLSPPWCIWVDEVKQLFKEDPEVVINYEEDTYTLTLTVSSYDKSEALEALLPAEKEFGNVKLTVKVVYAAIDKTNKDELFLRAFNNNPALSFVSKVDGIMSNSITYVVFRNKVVQYFNDDLSDYYGQKSTLYQYLADDVFVNREGVYFCTDVPDDQKTDPCDECPCMEDDDDDDDLDD